MGSHLGYSTKYNVAAAFDEQSRPLLVRQCSVVLNGVALQLIIPHRENTNTNKVLLQHLSMIIVKLVKKCEHQMRLVPSRSLKSAPQQVHNHNNTSMLIK